MMSFRLSDEFIAGYVDRQVPWGYTDVAGNSLGEITFLRTYSRKKEDGTKERWYEVCRRVIEGMFSIQKDHAKANRLPWSDIKAQRAAEDAFERLFTFKWTPPGRGLWMMGTPLVMEHRNSAALQNCAFVSTEDMTFRDPAAPFTFLMEASMLGIGVGFDTKGSEKGFKVYPPLPSTPESHYVIPDTREGWVESVKILLEAFLLKGGRPMPTFDYSQIRPAGEPIKTFGGTAAGPGPLMKLHEGLAHILNNRIALGRGEDIGQADRHLRDGGETLTSEDILDIGNLIGVCVVSGNVRRSAELALGSINDQNFLDAKDFSKYKENKETGAWDVTYEGSRDYRAEWGWMSNNSVAVNKGDDLSGVVEGIVRNGEPGIVWMDISREYGRLIDPPNGKDHRAAGYNPCAEQTLESYECCTLVETYLNRHEDLEDYKRTLKVAYLYAKTVTLIPTHWPETNAIMQRNRRIGTSMSGVANFADNRGISTLREWMDAGYETVSYYDRVYSEWLCVRESIKTTTVKPSGTVSILAGESPGVHWAPGGEFFERRIRFAKNNPMVLLFQQSGYSVEPAAEDPVNTVVITFPVHSNAKRSDKDVTLFEKVHLAAMAQRHWSDNSVSVTLTFDKETEGEHIPTVLAMYEGQLKTVSFLSQDKDNYKQMPYTGITKEEYEAYAFQLLPVDLSPIYQGLGWDAIGEAYCTTDACEIKTITNTEAQTEETSVEQSDPEPAPV